jgi:hypothetical protein
MTFSMMDTSYPLHSKYIFVEYQLINLLLLSCLFSGLGDLPLRQILHSYKLLINIFNYLLYKN